MTIALYAGIAYVLALGNIAYLVGFLANFGVPKSVASGSPGVPVWAAILIDAALVLGFGLQHSLTARRSFKRFWTRFVPAYVERATYLYMTAGMTALLVVCWQPVPVTVWRLESSSASATVWALFAATWLMMFAATFHFGHFGFLGLAQAWDRVRGREPGESPFTTRFLYRLVRHPITAGWMLVPWLTPHMTVGQLVFALSTAAYVLIATRYEEADLVEEFGDRYRRYQREVPAFVPRPRTRRADSADVPDLPAGGG